MSSMSPFYNVVTSDPTTAAEAFDFTSELTDLLMRYQKYLVAGGVPFQTLKQLKGGTTAVTQPGSGVVVVTITPNPVTPNPNPNAT